MKILIRCILSILSFTATILAAEGLLRFLGESQGMVPVPFTSINEAYRPPYTSNTATGWQLMPGNFQLQTGGRDRSTNVTIGQDASRITRAETAAEPSSSHKLLLVGDSYIFGEGLDNQETLPWKVQELMPERQVINHGVGGYGTCQAMLRLEQLEQSLASGDIVLYGFSIFHEERSSADPRQDFWIAVTSPSHRSGYPQCKLVNNQIMHQNSRSWDPPFPLTGRSVISRILTDTWLEVLARSAHTDQRELSYALISKMRAISISHGASFIVLLQEVPDDALVEYKTFMNQSEIAFIDGAEVTARGELKLPDGHPGPDMTSLWAKQIVAHLSEGSENSKRDSR